MTHGDASDGEPSDDEPKIVLPEIKPYEPRYPEAKKRSDDADVTTVASIAGGMLGAIPGSLLFSSMNVVVATFAVVVGAILGAVFLSRVVWRWRRGRRASSKHCGV